MTAPTPVRSVFGEVNDDPVSASHILQTDRPLAGALLCYSADGMRALGENIDVAVECMNGALGIVPFAGMVSRKIIGRFPNPNTPNLAAILFEQ